MLMPNRNFPHLSYEVLSDVATILENDLSKDWVIRIEYCKEVNCLTTSWQQWGRAFFNTTIPTKVIADIYSCHINNPSCAIRLHAEKFSPRTNFYFCICRTGSNPEDTTTAHLKQSVNH